MVFLERSNLRRIMIYLMLIVTAAQTGGSIISFLPQIYRVSTSAIPRTRSYVNASTATYPDYRANTMSFS
jgi:hypothetical protein